MNKTAKVTPIEKGKDLTIISNALEVFSIEEKVYQHIQTYTGLEIVDGKTEKDVRKARENVRDIRYKVQNKVKSKEKEINAAKKAEKMTLNEKAVIIYTTLAPIESDLDAKVKAVEAVKAEKKAEADRIKKEADEKINSSFTLLDTLAKTGLQYNRSSEEIANDLGRLEMFPISAVDFGERFDEAERVKADGIATTQTAFGNRLKWEEDQAESARVKKEQEAEAKKLAAERAEFEKARVAEREKQAEIQAKAEAEQKKKDDAAAKIAAQEAEKTRKANEKLEAGRKALEEEKAEIARVKQAEEEKKEIESIRVQAVNSLFKNFAICPNPESPRIVFDTMELKLVGATQAMFKTRLDEYQNLLQNEMVATFKRAEVLAYEENTLFDAAWDRARGIAAGIRIEKKQQDKERTALIGPDKIMITTIASDLDEMISECKIPVLNTAEANTMVAGLITALKTEIHAFETAGGGLV